MRHKIKIVVGCVLIITGFLATNIAVGQLTSLQNDTRTKCSGIVTEGGEKTVGREDGSYRTMKNMLQMKKFMHVLKMRIFQHQ